MGKKIDSFVVSVMLAGFYYLYFLRSTGNNILAFSAALFCCWVTVKCSKRIVTFVKSSKAMQKRNNRKLSAGAIMQLACCDKDVVLPKITELIDNSFHEKYSIVLIQNHPAEHLRHQEIFEAWKSRRGEEKLVICATCKCPDDVRMMVSGLENPRIAILDSTALQSLIADHPAEFILNENSNVTIRSRFKWPRIRRFVFNRRNIPRCLLIGTSSMMMYLLGGNGFYLFASTSLLLVALLSFRSPVKPTKLF